jgi:translation initiation factor IF-2
VCVTETSGCTSPVTPAPCPPDSDCKDVPADLIPPGACDPVVTKSCKPRYELHCNTAADCGGGFTCVAEMDCGCSAGTPSSGGSDDPAPSGAAAPLPPGAGGGSGVSPQPDCSCTPSAVSRCQLTLQACNFNSDCPSGLVCRSAPLPPQRDPGNDPDSPGFPGMGGTSGIGGAAGSAGTGAPNPGGAAEPPPPLPQPAELFCVPPNWSYPTPGGGGGSVGGSTGEPRPTPGGGPSSGTGGNPSVGGSTGVTGGAGGAGGKGEAPPTAPGNGASPDHTDGGCQVGAAGSGSSGFGVLAALGLAGLLRRRARRAA